MSLDDDARAELAALEAAHRIRVPRVVESRQGPTFLLDGVEVINLSSNDYLSLAEIRGSHARGSQRWPMAESGRAPRV